MPVNGSARLPGSIGPTGEMNDMDARDAALLDHVAQPRHVPNLQAAFAEARA